MRILVTGGAGYIGSHTCVELIYAGHDVGVIDNFSNSSVDAVRAVERITGENVRLYEADLLDYDKCLNAFLDFRPDAVMHFAGFKSVGESVKDPLSYYHNNITGSINLFRIMSQLSVNTLIFSSSATVYGNPDRVPVSEDSRLEAVNPYGATKLYIERIISDMAAANRHFTAVILRYFNPVGAHTSGLIGESPSGIPNNLMPYVTMVASGKMPYLSVFGGDYDTYDGTGVRDYIHVVDLAIGHVNAFDKLHGTSGVYVYNLGTGRGYSVLDVVKTFSEVCNVDVDYKIVGRRDGDVAECWADTAKSCREIGFKTRYGLDDMCRHAWNYEIMREKLCG